MRTPKLREHRRNGRNFQKQLPRALALVSLSVTFAAAGQAPRAVYGLTQPGFLSYEGGRLYVSNYDERDIAIRQRLTVIDISIPGEERILENFQSPLEVFDVEVVGGAIYVVDLSRRELAVRTADQRTWALVELTQTIPDQGNVKKSLFPIGGDRLGVLHGQRGLLDIVNISTLQLEQSIDLTGLHHRLSFGPDYVADFRVGLSEPRCDASGPRLSVYEPDFQLRFSIDVAGDCPFNVVAGNDRIYLIYISHIRSYDPQTGQLTGSHQVGPEFLSGFGLLVKGRGLLVHPQPFLGDPSGNLTLIDPALIRECADIPVTQTPLRIYPPLARMLFAEGRVFIANKNDDSVSILDSLPECTPSPGPGGFQ